MTTSTDQTAAVPSAQTLVDLCAGVIPVWARHLASSRTQSEAAVTEMMQAFASIGPHLALTQKQSQDIDRVLGKGDGAFANLAQHCEKLLSPVLDLGLPQESTTAIQTALAVVREAVDAVAHLSLPVSQETDAVAHQVERMYIGFQYQDRISQMIALLEGDIARLQQVLGGHATEVPNLDAWMERLESQYAMSEQHSNHKGNTAAQPGASAGDEATFF
jgi:hypothetical protein